MNGPNVDVIFELGLNHMGDLNRALRMVDELKTQGATRVTLQVVSDITSFTRIPETVGLLQKHCLNLDQNLQVIRHAKAAGLSVGATVLNSTTVEPLRAAGASFFKILSGDLTFDPLIKSVSATGLPVYISTGASRTDEIARAVKLARGSADQVDVRLIHTVLVVPTPPELLNLRNIPALSDRFGLPVAYGQHSDMADALDLAVAVGARALFVYVAERKVPGLPDGPHAIECSQVSEAIARIRLVERRLGTSAREISEREAGIRIAVRRSIVAARRIEKGQIVAEADITYKRPGGGIEPWDLPRILGKPATRDFDVGQDFPAGEGSESQS